ncbi:MAG: ATP-binding cassette domain-containing protein [Bifidobacterium dentium]
MLDIRDVSFGYGRRGEVLRSVSLHVPQARIVGMIGPNGSGKTTLINLVCDVLDLREGASPCSAGSIPPQRTKTGIMHVGGQR